jgi:RNA polymerase sigma-70 factor (ECF subfamily)
MDRDNLMNLLNGLPEAQRLVFNLYEIEGYAHDEIGEMLNMNTNTSRSYLARAKQRLRMKYKELYPDDYEQII